MIIVNDRRIRHNSRISNLRFEISRLELEIDYYQDKIRIYKESMWDYQSALDKALQPEKRDEEESR